MNEIAFLILAAGKGKRMKSSLPKVLHKICGKTMLSYVLDAVKPFGCDIGIVIGFNGDLVRKEIGEGPFYITQPKQAGTGDAVRVAKDFWQRYNNVVVLAGDVPFLSSDTLKRLIESHLQEDNVITLITAFLDTPTGYGRIVRDEKGNIVKIVEEKDASYKEKEIREVNAGVYCFDTGFLKENIDRLVSDNAQGEYYLTDLVKIAVLNSLKIGSISVEDNFEIMGINDRKALAEAEREYRRRINERLMLEKGVTIIDPQMTYISPDAEIGKDTVIYPMVFIEGRSVIGEGCIIGPNVRIVNSFIGNNVVIRENVVIEGSRIGDGCEVGPFAYLRPETILDESAYVGKFVEVKKSFIGKGSKVPHLSYIGDATIGERVNVGAGTITCNYDGVKKNPTFIEDDVFIGSDTMLVAPVRIGRGAFTGAGSVITKDVPPESLAIARAKQVNIEGWAKKRRGGEEKKNG
ncbi:MAG: bifunctional UDP-N-acetylglucosamine diphosphorylase/glucosamine-1-phosphate N-acetyltransferase GlmU [Synergistetes bacterium]|nr:MAG: Bifunctional protein GlmU [bacterium 42_11]MBC7331707.1 bifunctional UDP-N-acetylglucosamine diphosphorylase/glucosamine-1-phosphate N-acetyltransferase GlmU [Synergistota bacterium]MDK2872095.1 bifunctional UDP-N-acetylglucosamine pyrophosphorylase / glucosamine-phosphate N-acetyltransferase [bacterium]